MKFNTYVFDDILNYLDIRTDWALCRHIVHTCIIVKEGEKGNKVGYTRVIKKLPWLV